MPDICEVCGRPIGSKIDECPIGSLHLFENSRLEVADLVGNLRDSRTVLDVLVNMRALLDDPHHWIQGVEAADEFGVPTAPGRSTARCWCLVGALALVKETPVAWDTVKAIRQVSKEHDLGAFNDHVTHRDLLTYLDIAIDKNRRKPA